MNEGMRKEIEDLRERVNYLEELLWNALKQFGYKVEYRKEKIVVPGTTMRDAYSTSRQQDLFFIKTEEPGSVKK